MKIIKQKLNGYDYGWRFKRKPEYFIIHHSGSWTYSSMFNWFKKKSVYASAHFAIARDWSVYENVPTTNVAWHAGISRWWRIYWLNAHSLSVEVVSLDWKSYTKAQKTSLRLLTQFVHSEFGITKENVLRHSDITQNDKNRAIAMNLASDNDSQNMRECRKWDIWSNAFDWLGFEKWRDEVLKERTEILTQVDMMNRKLWMNIKASDPVTMEAFAKNEYQNNKKFKDLVDNQ